jgi:hypothetical protein
LLEPIQNSGFSPGANLRRMDQISSFWDDILLSE